MSKDVFIMGIESSCDETSISIVKNGREILSNVINSQISTHEVYGGVVPEIASRMHTEVINVIMKQALKEANLTLDEIDGIAVTYGPGLVGALLVGVSYAKALSFATNKPLIAINHINGHVAANYITHEDLEPPFLCLIISGGHTYLVNVKDYNESEIIGKTKDDAIGEAFDKVARVCNLGYPGGPKIDNLAKSGVPNINLPISHLENYNFTFSGIKTAVINLNHKDPNINKEDLCASFENAVTQMLIFNVEKVINEFNFEKVVLAGGVSRNSYIRNKFDELSKRLKIKVYYPDGILCTDNAAMIASSGYWEYLKGNFADLKLNAEPGLKL